MGLLEQEIKELRKMNKQLQEGKIKPEDVMTRIAIYSQTERRAKLLLQALLSVAKYGKKSEAAIHATNIIGEGSFIDLEEDAGLDKVVCPLQSGTITRNECLTLSGDSGNFTGYCGDCNNFNVTRRILRRL